MDAWVQFTGGSAGAENVCQNGKGEIADSRGGKAERLEVNHMQPSMTGQQQVGSILARDLHYRIYTIFAGIGDRWIDADTSAKRAGGTSRQNSGLLHLLYACTTGRGAAPPLWR